MRRIDFRRRSSAGRNREKADLFPSRREQGLQKSASRFDGLRTSENRFQVEAVSGVSGKISTILLSFPTEFLNSPDYNAVMTGLVGAMSQKTVFIVCIDIGNSYDVSKSEAIFRAAGVGSDRVRWVNINPLKVTPFVQDVCVCLAEQAGIDSGRHIFLEPLAFSRHDDRDVCDRVELALQHEVQSSGLLFQGGNMMISDRHILIGYDHYMANKPSNGDDGQLSAGPGIYQEFQIAVDSRRGLLPLGGNPVSVPTPIIMTHSGRLHVHYLHHEMMGKKQPLFHIDMFVTPLGEIDGQSTVVVGAPTANSQWNYSIDLLGHLPFDDVAAQLKKQNYRVVRIPIATGMSNGPYRSVKVDELSRQDETEMVLRESLIQHGAKPREMVELVEHHVLTWNNVVVENSGESGLDVIMPSYDHPLDDLCRQEYEHLGAKVSVLPDTTMLASLRGAAHCVIRDVARVQPQHVGVS